MVNKVAYLTKPKVFEICEEEPPELSDDEVLVEIKSRWNLRLGFAVL